METAIYKTTTSRARAGEKTHTRTPVRGKRFIDYSFWKRFRISGLKTKFCKNLKTLQTAVSVSTARPGAFVAADELIPRRSHESRAHQATSRLLRIQMKLPVLAQAETTDVDSSGFAMANVITALNGVTHQQREQLQFKRKRQTLSRLHPR